MILIKLCKIFRQLRHLNFYRNKLRQVYARAILENIEDHSKLEVGMKLQVYAIHRQTGEVYFDITD